MYTNIKNYEQYLIDDHGNVFNCITGNELKGSISENGYKYYRLSKSGKKKMFYAHRLVAEHFIDNPQNLPIVNHLDGNKLNNDVKNLEWTTYSENVKHFHNCLKASSYPKGEFYLEDLPDEQWVIAKYNHNYRVSSYGRVYNINTKRLLRPSLSSGYQLVHLCDKGKVTSYCVHKLVFFSFHPDIEEEKGACIDHINGNKLNNCLTNLRQITNSENVQAAYYQQKTNLAVRQVEQCSLTGEHINSFPSIREASRVLSLDSSSISKCCRNKVRTVGGFIFKYL